VIQIKLVRMSMIFHYNKLRLSEPNESQVVSMQQNINFNFQIPSTLLFLVFHKNGFIKSSSSFEDLSAHKFHGPTLTDVSHPPQKSEHPRSGVVEATGLKIMPSRSPSTS
jgi:hypothetical protein